MRSRPSDPPPRSKSTARRRPPPARPARGPVRRATLPSAAAGPIPAVRPASRPPLSPAVVPARCAPALLVPVKHAQLRFVPFHAGLRRFLLPPAGAAKAHLKPVEHQHRQRRRRAGGDFFLRGRCAAGPGFALRPWPPSRCTKRLDRGVFHRTAHLGRQFRRRLIRAGHGGEVSQFVFQRRTELLVGAQSPVLPDRTAPASVSRILSVPHAQGHRAEGGAQVHRLPPPMLRFAPALGEKLRRGGRLASWSFSSSRRRIHSRPSASTSSSISRSERGSSDSEFIEFLSFMGFVLLG